MHPVCAVAHIRSLEAVWASQNGGTTRPLMQQAGTCCVALTAHLWPNAQRIWVLAGTGNNGGDAYIAAAHWLRQAKSVQVIAPLGLPKASSDAAHAHQVFVTEGGVVLAQLPKEPPPDLLVDALFGIGFRGALPQQLTSLLTRVRGKCPVLAVDVPSGLNADTGIADPACLFADHTLSFIAFKPGLLTADGPSVSGQLHLERLGMDCPTSTAWRDGVGSYLEQPPPLPKRESNCHKGCFGRVRVFAGRLGMQGAGFLGSRAALVGGAGQVVWHTEGQAETWLASQPELMTASLDPGPMLKDDTLLVGPGFGLDAQAESYYQQLLQVDQPKGVLDADGLSWLAQNPRLLPGWVLTPHPGEAGRLLGTSAKQVQQDRCQAVIKLSEVYQATVVLKGAGTLIADQGRLMFSHPGTGAMASPGMGDVLAGFIASLMAQGLQAYEAAYIGAWWHSYLATGLAKQCRIVLATDILNAIQRANN